MRTAARRDNSEPAILKALDQLGGTFMPINGRNSPDGIVGHGGRDYKVEIKTGKAKLRDGQRDFARGWRGSPIFVLRTVDDLLVMLGIESGTVEIAR